MVVKLLVTISTKLERVVNFPAVGTGSCPLRGRSRETLRGCLRGKRPKGGASKGGLKGWLKGYDLKRELKGGLRGDLKGGLKGA